MGTLFSALNIGKSGLMTAQVQLDVSAHNVANVNTDGYSRQRAILTTAMAQARSYGQVGQGVTVSDIERVRDEYLDKVYREQVSGLGAAETRDNYFSQIEDLFQEPGESGFGTQLDEFFGVLNDFANNVEEEPVRMSVITGAESLATAMNQMTEELTALQTSANEEIISTVPQINSYAKQISELNVQIVKAEVQGGTANDLRDTRDRLLDELSKLVDVNYRERDDGQVDVNIGGESLITGATYRDLETVRDPSLSATREDLVDIRFVDNGKSVKISDGSLYGALVTRDEDIPAIVDSINTIAKTIIEQVNKINSTGHGQDTLSDVTSSNAASDATVPLNNAGLPFTMTAGTLDVVTYDSSGTATTTSIAIDPATMTLDDLVAAINMNVPSVTATVTADNKLNLVADANTTFSFSGDTSNVLVALGVNGMFTGSDAASMSVNQAMIDNPLLLSSSYSTDLDETGNNEAALELAGLQDKLLLGANNSATVNQYYEALIVSVGVSTSANSQQLDIQEAFVKTFEEQRTSVSGVSSDEEAANLTLYQHAYEAAARVISITDSMLTTLLGMAT